MDAKCRHQGIPQNLLPVVAALHGLHAEHGNPFLVIHMAESLTYLIIYMLSIRYHHHPFHVSTIADNLHGVDKQFLGCHHLLDRNTADKKFSQGTIESLAVQVGKSTRQEIVHLLLLVQ